MSKSVMVNILNEIDKYPELCKFFNLLSDKQKASYLNAIRNLRRGILYKSPIHGEYHSEKVTLFAILLGVQLNCTDKELEILLDAGMYHDHMRESDNDDNLHGMSSAINIDRAIPIGKYTKEELSILQAIIDYHSVDTRIHTFKDIAWNYDIEDNITLDRARKLASILKDADALDRKRFSDDSIAALNPAYLENPEALKMIDLSAEINNAYLDKTITKETTLSNQYLYRNTSSCLHSIGKNIFRLNSVLDNGLLSYSKLCEVEPSFQRNFDGGNSDRWISVVPTNKLDENGGAAKEFLKHGIVFLFEKTDLYYPDKRVTSSYAKSYGLPYTKNSGYSDEQYAYESIPKEKITAVLLDKKFASKDLRELEHYVYDSFNYELFEKNVIAILEKMNLINNGQFPADLIEYMEQYKVVAESATACINANNLMVQDMYAEKLLVISGKINRLIGNYLHNHFAKLLNKDVDDTITMKDIVEYELSISNYDYESIDSDQICYFVTPKVKNIEGTSKFNR